MWRGCQGWRAYFSWKGMEIKMSLERFTAPLQHWNMIVPCRSKRRKETAITGRKSKLIDTDRKHQSCHINLPIVPGFLNWQRCLKKHHDRLGGFEDKLTWWVEMVFSLESLGIVRSRNYRHPKD